MTPTQGHTNGNMGRGTPRDSQWGLPAGTHDWDTHWEQGTPCDWQGCRASPLVVILPWQRGQMWVSPWQLADRASTHALWLLPADKPRYLQQSRSYHKGNRHDGSSQVGNGIVVVTVMVTLTIMVSNMRNDHNSDSFTSSTSIC